MADVVSKKYKKKVSTSCSSYIPDDIGFSILSKLPLKSLTRFTCAKKSCSLLLQNPNFMDMFRTNFFISKHHDEDDTTCLFIEEISPTFPFDHDSLYILSGDSFQDRVKFDWPLRFREKGIRILGSASVNGILCLFYGDASDTTIVLWNPATEEFKTLPPSYEPYVNKPCNYLPRGFGYDCIRDDYKVVRVAPCYGVYSWEIYSLKSNSWRKLDRVDMRHIIDVCNGSLNMNEFCHWFGYVNEMVSFDFRNDIFFSTTLPLEIRKHRKLLELNGYVSLIYNDNIPDYFQIWILGDIGVKESWTKLSIVGPLSCSIMRPIVAGKKSHIFFKKEFKKEGDWLAWYDFDVRTQRISQIGAKGEWYILGRL